MHKILGYESPFGEIYYIVLYLALISLRLASDLVTLILG